MWLVHFNYNFECDWITELSDNKLSDNKGRVPFDQKFRFEFPKFSCVEWNGIFYQAGPISFNSHLSTFPTKNNLRKCWRIMMKVAVLNAVLSCFMCRRFTRIPNSTLPWYLWEKLTKRTGPQEIRNDQSTIFQKSYPNVFVFDQEQARTMADHFASSVVLVSTRKTRRHLVAFHD